MKKLLLFLGLFTLVFGLSACDEATVLDSITDVEDSVLTIEADITALETEIAMLEASMTEDTASFTSINSDITDINEEIIDISMDIIILKSAGHTRSEAIDELEEAIAELEAAVAVLEDQVGLVAAWKDLTTTEIVLMYNNDVHGRVDDGYGGVMGYATIKNIIDEVRMSYNHTYLVSAGDMFHGTTFATLEEGESFVEVMNAVGYDLMVPGNHDFDYGQDQLLVLEEMADFPIISSNIQYDADDSDMFEPYFIETFGDVSVGFFGVTTPDTTYMTHPDNVIGLNFLDPIAQATAMVAALEDEEVDLIVMLGHIGLDESSSITSEDIAAAVDGIDVIIDGHSHSYLPSGFMVNDTLIVSTGEYNENFGVLELTIEDGEIIVYNNLLINANEAAMFDLGTDQEIQDLIDAIKVDQDAILSIVVGQTAVVLDGERADVRTSETNLGKLIADSMISVTGADLAITNGGGIRASIAAGDITRGDVITTLPFGNIIVTVDLTGQEIIDTLEHAITGLPAAVGSFPHVSGVTFTIDMNNEEGSRIEAVMINGVAIDVNAVYSVATNDFMAAGGDGFEALGNADTTGEFMGLHEALESMFTVGTDVVVPIDVRITIIPLTE